MVQENLNDLLAFIAVARERSFTRAAAQLGVSQSALSRTVRAMEERLGLRLLTRTTRSVAMTEAGERLFTTVSPRLDEIRGDLEALSILRDRPAGRVRITATDFAARTHVWPRLKEVIRTNPDLQVEIVHDYSLSNIVADGYEIGIRLGDQVEKDMIASRIAPDMTMVVIGSPLYFDNHPAPIQPEDLTEHNCINLRLPTRGALLPWELTKGRRQIQARVTGQLTFNSVYEMLDAALEGLGLAYVPQELAAPYVEEGRLRYALEGWFPTFTGHYVFYPNRGQSSSAVVAVVAALKAGAPK
jgi:DNA-binding transcriptional LysR family regulator